MNYYFSQQYKAIIMVQTICARKLMLNMLANGPSIRAQQLNHSLQGGQKSKFLITAHKTSMACQLTCTFKKTRLSIRKSVTDKKEDTHTHTHLDPTNTDLPL